MSDQMKGALRMLAVAVVAAAAWVAWGEYRAGQVSHTQAQAAANVLFRPANAEFLITDDRGVKRPATIAEILEVVARERVQRFQQEQAAASTGK